MTLLVDICDRCLVNEPQATLRRCKRCLVLGCGHKRRAWKCNPRDEQCEDRQLERVKHAWIAELAADGYCVTPTGRIDGHGKFVSSVNGRIHCSFCNKPLGPDCEKCGGAGWLRGDELGHADEATRADSMTKYTCDRCKGTCVDPGDN